MATKRQASKATRTARAARTVDVMLRVSQRGGREGDAFHSPAEQLDTCKRFAKAHGLRIGKVFDETDSVSGGTTDRELLQQAMQRALDGTTDGIIVSAVDRFGRTLVEGVTEIKRLQAAGASFIAVDQGIDTGATSAATRATTNLLLGFMFLLAEWQREMLTDKWTATRHRHIEVLGVHSQTPYGYRKHPDTRVLMPSEPEASHVREMYERRARGESWSNIARAINEKGGRTRNGKLFTVSRVSYLIKLRVYLGEVYSGHDIVNPNAHEPLTTPELWERANARAGKRGSENRGRTSDRFLLTGIVRCATCGQTMAGSIRKGAQPRYRCRGDFSFGKCKRPASIFAETVERIAIEALHAEALTMLTAEGTEATHALDQAQHDLDRAKAALTAWTTDVANDVLRTEAPEAYEAGTRVRLDAVREATERVTRERNTAGVRADLPANLGELWDTLGNDDKRAWLSAWYSVIAVAPGDVQCTAKNYDPNSLVALFTVDDPNAPTGFSAWTDGDDGRRHRFAVERPITMPAR